MVALVAACIVAFSGQCLAQSAASEAEAADPRLAAYEGVWIGVWQHAPSVARLTITAGWPSVALVRYEWLNLRTWLTYGSEAKPDSGQRNLSVPLSGDGAIRYSTQDGKIAWVWSAAADGKSIEGRRGADGRIVLRRASDDEERFAPLGIPKSTVSQAGPWLGTWEGLWNSTNLRSEIDIAWIGDASALVRYSFFDQGRQTWGWWWFVGRMQSGRTIVGPWLEGTRSEWTLSSDARTIEGVVANGKFGIALHRKPR